MKTRLVCLLLALAAASPALAQQYQLSSPGGQLKVQISNGDSLRFSVSSQGQTLVSSVTISMTLADGRVLAVGDRVRKAPTEAVRDSIRPVVAIKNAVIPDNCNQLTLQYRNGYSVVFRAYDDAVAYRFETKLKDTIDVTDERCDVRLAGAPEAWFAYTGRWMNSYEHMYQKQPLDSLDAGETVQLPLLVDLHDPKVLITESGLYDYPGLYFTGDGSGSLRSVFPPAVKSEEKNDPHRGGWDRNFRPASRYDYLARTAGTRSFPWRIFAVATRDADLLNNEIVYKLAAPSRLQDVSWIRPGQVAWDWWNHWNITGVDFRAGVNTQTYKYYIDFAARHHIPYIIMDEGWYKLGNMTERVPSVDVQAIADYGRQKGVGVILWCVWRTLDNQMEEAMDLFNRWGVKGIKVDFMDRDDQAVVNFYWRCAEAAARHHLLVDYHGAHKPAGIQRTLPNVVNFEGVPGLEQDKWTDSMATPPMAVTLPYIRMFAGPMDYTPGAMRNAQRRDFRPINDNPMSLGTRCQQLAMYVLFDAPLQMLADNPTAYEKEPESLEFITSVPTTWDATIPLDGQVGEYVVMARRKGQEYFVGAMNNWRDRDLTIDLSFLPAGSYHMVLFRDGINADRNGTDYKREERTVTNRSRVQVELASGGGWVARIYP